MKPHLLAATFVFSISLLLPGSALANYSNQLDDDDNNNDDFIQQDLASSPVDTSKDGDTETNQTELQRAHSDITDIMIEQNITDLENYKGPNIPFTMVSIDDDTLVVGLDPIMVHEDLVVTPEVIQEMLGISAPVEIKYLEFTPDAADPVRVKSWQDRYKNSCMPVKPAYVNACPVYERIMKSQGIPLPSDDTTSDSTKPVITQSYDIKNINAARHGADINLTWDRPDFTVKEYEIYSSDNGGITYQYKTKLSKYSTSYTLSNVQEGKDYKFQIKLYYNSNNGQAATEIFYSNTVSIPRTTPAITYDLDNFRTTKSGDSIIVSWSHPTDYTVKYYKIYVSENGGGSYKYPVKKYSPFTSYTVSDIEEGKNYKVKVKVYYANSQGSTSTKYFYSDSVVVPRTTPVDRTPPVITAPQTVTKSTADASGIIVDYAVSAQDKVDGSVTVSCTISSGTKFAVGTSIVTCTATDKAGNKSQTSITVTVSLVCESPLELKDNACVNPGMSLPDLSDTPRNPIYPTCSIYETMKDSDVCVFIPPTCPTNSFFKNNKCVRILVNNTTKTCPAGTDVGPRGMWCVTPSLRYTIPGLTSDGHIAGGTRHTVSYTYSSTKGEIETHNVHGTVALAATNTDGVDGIVVAAHTLFTLDKSDKNTVTPLTQKHIITHNNGEIKIWDGIVTPPDIFNKTKPRSSDSAFIPVLDSVTISQNKILDNSNNVHTVSGIISDADLIPGLDVSIYGIYTESDGEVLYTDATVHVDIWGGEKFTLLHQIIAHYPSIRGDSGAPIVHTTDTGDLKMVGIHSGYGCNITPVGSSKVITPKNCLEVFIEKDRADNADKSFSEHTFTPQYKQLTVLSPWKYVTSELDLR